MRTAMAVNWPVLGLAALLALLLAALPGCTGSQNTQSSQVRFINAVPNGGTATFSAGGAFAGDEPFFAQTQYQTVIDTTTTFSFFLSANPATTFTSASTVLVN